MEMGFATINKSISQKEFIKSFIDYYGEEFLCLVQSEVDADSETNWLMDMLRKKNKTNHPIRHLLLARFLGISIDNLFNKRLEYKPFGDGPWPCLNKASDHYLQPVVTDMKVTYGTDVKRPIGTFKCSCGFIYARSGPDLAEDARYTIGRIKAFGSVWESRLKELAEEKLTLRETARLLGVDPGTVKKYAKKLGLVTYWEKRSNDDNESVVNYSKGASGNDYNKRDISRDEWISLQKKNPDKGKTELRQMNKVLFTWLYRNDREWLNNNSPAKKRVNNGYIRVDWDSRDKEILPKVEGIVKDMLNSKEKPERISISKIGSKLGIRALLEKHLDKLPRTKAYLDSVKESGRDFRVRRIKWAIRELEKEGQELKEWRIIRKAGIRKEYQENIEIELENLIGQNKYFR
jgi:DNA-binding MarR family transcriptional regulator